MPWLIKIRTKAKAFSIAHQPLVNRRLDLNGTIRIPGIDRVTADVKVQRAAGEVRTVNGKAGAAGIRRLAPQLLLIFARAKSGQDFQVFLCWCEFAVRRMSKTKRWIRDCCGNQSLVCRVGLALDLT